ncbi:unnamed protein product [Arctogadus glacialis]
MCSGFINIRDISDIFIHRIGGQPGSKCVGGDGRNVGVVEVVVEEEGEVVQELAVVEVEVLEEVEELLEEVVEDVGVVEMVGVVEEKLEVVEVEEQVEVEELEVVEVIGVVEEVEEVEVLSWRMFAYFRCCQQQMRGRPCNFQSLFGGEWAVVVPVSSHVSSSSVSGRSASFSGVEELCASVSVLLEANERVEDAALEERQGL